MCLQQEKSGPANGAAFVELVTDDHAVDADPDTESSFTPYLRAIESRVYKHSREL